MRDPAPAHGGRLGKYAGRLRGVQEGSSEDRPTQAPRLANRTADNTPRNGQIARREGTGRWETADFCHSPRDQWRYRAGSKDWLACEKCHAAIQADDREALLDRVMLAPVPRTLPDRYAPRFRAQARQLHERFWSAKPGPAELA
jgi:hypothetical protein